VPIVSPAMGPSTVWAWPASGERVTARSLLAPMRSPRRASAGLPEIRQPPDEGLVQRAVPLPGGDGLVGLRQELGIVAPDRPSEVLPVERIPYSPDVSLVHRHEPRDGRPVVHET